MDRLADGYRALAEACVLQAQALAVQQTALMRMRTALAQMADLLDPPREAQPSRPLLDGDPDYTGPDTDTEGGDHA
jgi:hypothetical protein